METVVQTKEVLGSKKYIEKNRPPPFLASDTPASAFPWKLL